MATPYVAGAYALFLEWARSPQNIARLDPTLLRTDSTSIRELFQNYAAPTVERTADAKGLFTSVARQGAGLIQVDRSILGGNRVSPGKLPVGLLNEVVETTITIHNGQALPKSYALSHEAATTVNITDSYDPVLTGTNGTVRFYNPSTSTFTDSLTIKADPFTSTQVRIQIIPDPTALASASSDSAMFYVGGYIMVEPSTWTPSDSDSDSRIDFSSFNVTDYAITVPYVGMVGEPGNLQVLDIQPGNAEFKLPPTPCLLHRDSLAFFPGRDTLSISSLNPTNRSDSIIIAYRTTAPAAWISLNIFDASTKQMVGTVFNETHMGKNKPAAPDSLPRFTHLYFWNSSYTGVDGQVRYTEVGKSYFLILSYALPQFVGQEGQAVAPGAWIFPKVSFSAVNETAANETSTTPPPPPPTTQGGNGTGNGNETTTDSDGKIKTDGFFNGLSMDLVGLLRQGAEGGVVKSRVTVPLSELGL
ncbi:hypothetical protein HK102_010181 [Quaeritorhiza haematococci]|nr:hypothetical protein HK102_010181 [Quaeritorhiza haematococci]